ncbi:MAG: hypothetical protein AABY22_25135 [Nanoarchaeota archaeon]
MKEDDKILYVSGSNKLWIGAKFYRVKTYGIFRAYKTFWKKNTLRTAIKVVLCDKTNQENLVFGQIANFQIDENVVTIKKELNPVIIAD